ncbi:NUDIX domain-containing protein [Candidatus Falkowbacteria bacterium]|nr:NUDIX domain-containing protein [Candidatus Falkowbacteria bacterium]
MEIKVFTATKAFVSYQNKILILRESNKYQDGTNAGKYDVPGGRIKPGQRFDESLLREIKEETGLEVKIGKPFFVNEWRPEKNGELWQIVGVFFECVAESDRISLSEDHDDFKWIEPRGHKNYNLIENLHPAFVAYLNK